MPAACTALPALPLPQNGAASDPGYAGRAKESIRANARWVERHGAATCEWVAKQPGAKAGG